LAAIDRTRLSNLIGRVYEAGLAPQAWPSVLKDLARALNAKSALLRTLELRERPAVLASHHFNLDPHLQAQYCARFVGQDPYLERLRRLPAGRMVTNDALVDLETFRHTPFYRHYFRPLDNHFITGGFVENRDGVSTIFGLHRHRHARRFENAELHTVQLLAPHMARAVQLGRRLTKAERRADSAEQALEALGVATFLLDGRGRVTHANALGERLARSPEGPRIERGGHLGIPCPSQSRPFREMLERVRRGACGEDSPAAESILLGGEAGTFLATAYPVPDRSHRGRDPWTAARVAVYVGDLDDTGLLRPETLANLYGLTPAESRLAVALARGRELPGLSEDWGLSPETLRSQLKGAFAKTGVRRQSELVRLLAGAPWKLTTLDAGEAPL